MEHDIPVHLKCTGSKHWGYTSDVVNSIKAGAFSELIDVPGLPNGSDHDAEPVNPVIF